MSDVQSVALIASDLDPRTLVRVLLDDGRRAALLSSASWGDGSENADAIARAAVIAEATPDELSRVVELLVGEGRADCAAWFFDHACFPEETLLSLAERGHCLSALGHRRAPRRLLERMVELHAYPEAVLSLALVLYRDPNESFDAFAAHARKHASSAWMLRTLAEVEASDLAKEELYESLLGDAPDAAAFHARHLAQSERCELARFERFVTDAHSRVLVLLLGSEITDIEKRDLVVRLAEAREDEAVVLALRQHRAVARAESETLTPDEATALYDLGIPDVLVALASNPRAPRELLQRLTAHRGTQRARTIRTNAAESLRKRR